MIAFSVSENELILKDITVEFKYPIFKAEELNNTIILILEFKNQYDQKEFYNALYAVSKTGEILWQIEDVKKHIGDFEPSPLNDFTIYQGQLLVFDFFSRRFTVDPDNGKIIDMKVGRW